MRIAACNARDSPRRRSARAPPRLPRWGPQGLWCPRRL